MVRIHPLGPRCTFKTAPPGAVVHSSNDALTATVTAAHMDGYGRDETRELGRPPTPVNGRRLTNRGRAHQEGDPPHGFAAQLPPRAGSDIAPAGGEHGVHAARSVQFRAQRGAAYRRFDALARRGSRAIRPVFRWPRAPTLDARFLDPSKRGRDRTSGRIRQLEGGDGLSLVRSRNA